MLFLIWVIAVLSSMYLYLRKIYSKFSTLGVNHLPVVPLLGNTAPIILRGKHLITNTEKIYKTFPDDKIVGFYEFMAPVFMIKDLELLKKITIKDFDHFVDRRGLPDHFKDPLFTKNLIALKGKKWRAMRSTLRPTFTASKVLLMVPSMIEGADVMIKDLTNKIYGSKDGYIDVETKDMSARCAADVLADCAYGIKVNCTDGDDDFYTNCRKAGNLSVWELIKIMLMKNFPNIARVLNLKLKPKLSKFFNKLVQDMMSHREQNNIVRNDMIQILKEAKKEWSDEYLVPQGILFLLAGFETVSTVMAFLLHELALHPEIQERLYQEIKENQRYNGNFDFNSVQTMNYLDMVISEGLRLWPPALFTERTCVKDCNLGKPNEKAEKDIIIRKDDEIQLSIWMSHRNPKYFPEPEKFDPERFSEANKHNIEPFTYIPFGLGPRGCVGSRFALSEIKVMLYKVLLNMQVTTCERTCVPTRLAVCDIFPRIEGGHWLRLTLRAT